MTDTAPPSRLRQELRFIFKGKDGLRAGWSLFLFFALFALAMTLAIGVVTALHVQLRSAPGAPQPLRGTLIIEAISFGAVALAAWLVSLIERRPFETYGLRRTSILPDLLKGMAWGVVMLSLLVGLLALTGALAFDGVALAAGPALVYGAGWFLAFCLVGLFEEFLTRGFPQYTLARGVAGIVDAIRPRSRYARTIGFWVAASVFSVGIFAAGHIANKGETVMGLVAVGLAGLTFVYALYRTGSLWWAIGFHATWDWAQSYLYGVADSGGMMEGHLLVTHPTGAALLSGGATGPEGSILVVPTLLLTMLVIRVTLPRRATAFDAPASGDARL